MRGAGFRHGRRVAERGDRAALTKQGLSEYKNGQHSDRNDRQTSESAPGFASSRGASCRSWPIPLAVMHSHGWMLSTLRAATQGESVSDARRDLFNGVHWPDRDCPARPVWDVRHCNGPHIAAKSNPHDESESPALLGPDVSCWPGSLPLRWRRPNSPAFPLPAARHSSASSARASSIRMRLA